MIEQKFQEWCVKMWIATIDFMKAFDSIKRYGTPSKLVVSDMNTSASCRDYTKTQKATVIIDKESDMFETKKGLSRVWPAI